MRSLPVVRRGIAVVRTCIARAGTGYPVTAPEVTVAERESIRKLFTRLHQAYRGLRLYPSDHPAARRSIEEFARALSGHLDKFGPLPVLVDEDQLVFNDQPVYFQEDTRGNLAFMMFRDGIRFLEFQPGITQHEIEALVDCLSQAEDLATIEYDLTTALWEHDLQHVYYEVVDPFMGAGGQGAREDAMSDLRETVVRRFGELPAASPAEDDPGGGFAAAGSGRVIGAQAAGEGEGAAAADLTVDEDDGEPEEEGPSGVDVASVTLTAEELEQGEQAVADLGRTTLSDFALVLLEIAGRPTAPPEGTDVLARSLTLVAEQYLDAGDLEGFAGLAERLLSLEERGRRPHEFGRSVIGAALMAERLTRLIERGNEGAQADASRVEGLLTRVRDWIIPSLLETLAESSDRAVRRVVLALLDIEGGVPVRYLWPLMGDLRWYVVRNAVQLATGSGDPELLGHLERLLHHHDARVRREVIRSLDSIGGNTAGALLARALGDEDSSVRTLAAHGLARHGGRAQLGAIQGQVDSRDLDTRPAEEVGALLWAYAVLGGDATVDALGKIWKRRLFGARPLAVRSAAVQALGAIGTPAARDALRAVTKSGEAQLQRVAARALSGPGGGATGQGT